MQLGYRGAMDEPTPSRGRPPILSTSELRSRAIAVVRRYGFEAVTMKTVAAELGVSLRTLHRHFPSKVDLVWGALDESFVRLRGQLALTDPDIPVIAAIQSAIIATFTVEDVGWQRERLRLIATTPELQSAQSVALRQWRDDIAAFAASRLGLAADDLVPVALGAAVQSATLAGLTWWATHEDVGSASDVVGRALRALEAPGS